MASPTVIDIDKLLAPIAGDNPCGENLNALVDFDDIKALREQRDTDPLGHLEDQKEESTDWSKIVELASGVLAERSKHLSAATYLTEALVHLHGFAGLRDGLRLICGLVGQFWDHLYPEIDEEDAEEPLAARLSPLLSLTEADRGMQLPNTIRGVRLADSNEEENGVISWNFWKTCTPPPKGQEEDDSAYADRRARAEQRKLLFDESLNKAPQDRLKNLHDDLQEALEAIAEFDRLVDEKFGDEAPGSTALRKACEDCTTLLRSRLPERSLGPVGAPTEPQEVGGQNGPSPGVRAGPIHSREEAFRRLEEIAAYLRQTDPHSPVSYLVFRAVKWSSLAFDDLLEELVQESDARDRICDLLGIRHDEES